MQKLICLLTVAAFHMIACISALAQHSSPETFCETIDKNSAGPYFPAATCCSASKTTGTEVRLASIVTGSDSSVYSYADGKSGYFDSFNRQWIWQFDTVLRLNGSLSATALKSKTYDIYDNCTLIKSYDWNTSLGSWQGSMLEYFTFDGMHDRIAKLVQFWDAAAGGWANIDYETYSFTPDNRPTGFVRQIWTGTVWKNAAKVTYTYDVNDDLIAELGETWIAATSTWDTVSRTTFTYDTDHNKLSALGQGWYLGTWENSYRFLYTGFVVTQPSLIVYQTWDIGAAVFQDVSRTSFEYNSYNMPGKSEYMHWSVGEYFESVSHYNYEPITAGITNTIDNVSCVSVYPIPARNTLTIDIIRKEAEPVYITISDVQGRVRCSIEAPSCLHYKETLPIAELSTGNYVVIVSGRNGKVTRLISVVK